MHRFWKRNLVRRVVARKPSAVLDIASGTGDIAIAIARALPQTKVIASDFSPNMLEVAAKRSHGAGLSNLETSEQDAMKLSYEDASFDAVCVSFGLRNMSDYEQVICEMVRVLRPGGLFLCLDASYPTNPVIKPFFRLYFKYLMPRLGGLVARAPEEYRWLNDSTEVFLSKTELASLMAKCGLSHVGYRSFMMGGSALHWGTKPTK
jgi:demethylmenaquinone methyltransferase/2-methoxy-6-polyprenyl-1,4-benzoquinol methylase